VANANAAPFTHKCSAHADAVVHVDSYGTPICQMGNAACPITATPNIAIVFTAADGNVAPITIPIRSTNFMQQLWPGVDMRVYYAEDNDDYLDEMTRPRYAGIIVWASCYPS
jgi:hypothetical protein